MYVYVCACDSVFACAGARMVHRQSRQAGVCVYFETGEAGEGGSKVGSSIMEHW